MSVEDRIRKLAEQVIACQDDGETAVLAEKLQDAIRQRVILLRMKHAAIPLGQCNERLN